MNATDLPLTTRVPAHVAQHGPAGGLWAGRHRVGVRSSHVAHKARSGQRGAAGVLILASLAGALAATVLAAPARWLAQPLAQATQGRLTLVNPYGTIWQGQGGLMFNGGEGSADRAALPGNLTWQLRPSWSADGVGLALALHMPCCMATPIHISWQPGWQHQTLRIAAHQSQWPAEMLTGLGAPWNTLQLQASLALNTPGLTLQLHGNRMRGQGSATLDVANAASRLSTVKPMGSYRLTWQWPQMASGDTHPPADPTLSLHTVSGALQLTGTGQWVSGRLRFEGVAEAASGREEALNNLMNLLGRRQGSRTLIKIG